MHLKVEELHSDNQLINSKFDGYKLSLNEIPRKKTDLPYAVREVMRVDDNFSYLYMNLVCLHNHLVHDPWNENSFYYINKQLSVAKIEINIDGDTENIVEMLSIPSSSESTLAYEYNANIVFSGSKYAVLSDGAGLFYIINTGNRSNSQNWIIEHSSLVFGDNYSFCISDARYVEESNEITMHCITTAVINEKFKKTNVPRTYEELRWIVFKKIGDGPWCLEDSFQITCKGLVRYAHFSPRCECLFVESTKSLNFPEEPETETVRTKEDKEESVYYWQQSNDDIKLWITLPSDCSKDDLRVSVEDKSLKISAKSLIIEGELCQLLNPELTTWNVEDKNVEIVFVKLKEGLMWKYLLENNNQGQEVVDPALVKDIHERLAHLCSEMEDESVTSDPGPVFNLGQLEACDSSIDEDSKLVAIDTSTKKITREVDIRGRQKLFNLHTSPTEAPYFCFRHDVDGTLWELDYNRSELCKHVGTLNAFGYVLASKERKFSTCSPDLSYAVIAASKHNLFVYKQNCRVNSVLKNRKTGFSYSQIGKQFLINLASADDIVGLHASNNFLCVLTTKSIQVFRMQKIE